MTVPVVGAKRMGGGGRGGRRSVGNKGGDCEPRSEVEKLKGGKKISNFRKYFLTLFLGLVLPNKSGPPLRDV